MILAWRIQAHLHQEAVTLSLRQRKRAVHVVGVLRRQHGERSRQRMRGTVNGYRAFLHGFQQSALGAGRSSVDLIRQQQVCEQWTRAKAETAARAAELIELEY